jgi:prepilin signal peptidase PulO-like enzyme (type II secretory pathway)
VIVDVFLLSFWFLIGLCWGSFLNVVGYRLINGPSVFYPLRSQCTLCKHTLTLFDLVPLLSWFWLKAHCRYCKKPISFLYPLIEFTTGIVSVLLYMYISYNISYFIFAALFCSALIIIIRSDLETMLISQWTTLFLVPVAFTATLCMHLPISFFESVIGACSAYVFLYCISFFYRYFKKIEGIGQGDIDMLCMIGAFLGPIGWWLTLIIASFTGTIIAIGIMICSSKNVDVFKKIPFGPFLAIGSFVTLFWQRWLIAFLIPSL